MLYARLKALLKTKFTFLRFCYIFTITNIIWKHSGIPKVLIWPIIAYANYYIFERRATKQ